MQSLCNTREPRSKHPPAGKLHSSFDEAWLAALKRELANYDPRADLQGMGTERRRVRAQARAIIEGREPWPKQLHLWKLVRETEGYDNPWEDLDNMTLPQREHECAKERARAKHEAAIRAGWSDARIAREAPHPSEIAPPRRRPRAGDAR
jgi:hypothetical protein